MNIKEEELKIPYQGEKLYGVLYSPEEKRKKSPLIIVSHGFYASHELMKETSMCLAENGYMTYCFDYRGCSYSRKSGGKLEESSIQTEIDDLSAVIGYFEQRDDIDAEHIYLAGQSMGGVVSALTAAARQDQISGLILMCPAMNMKDTCRQYFSDIHAIPDIVENFIGIPGLNLGRVFFDDLFATDFNDMFLYKKPVFLLHGTADEMVPLSFSEELARKFSRVRFVKVPDAKHDFKLDNVLAKEVIDYLNAECC